MDQKSGNSRRTFLKTSAAAVAGGTLTGDLLLAGAGVHSSAGEQPLRLGVVGCGGRGGGAVGDALAADPDVTLVAMADVFPDHLNNKLRSLKRRHGDRIAVSEETKFTGFDAYQQMFDANLIDVVILATPPHFRPKQFAAAVDAGLHVFCEKPVAVDAPGVRSVIETSKKAKAKGLNVVSGLCWRYDPGVSETMKRVMDGAIGDIVAIQENYLTGELWHRGNKEAWSPMEYQLRNWLYFAWLSGDHNVEQHIHSLDKGSWAMGDKPPLRCVGIGGRQVRKHEKYGHIFDHHSVIYEYPNNVRMFSFTRQQDNTYSNTEDYFLGTNGSCNVLARQIRNRAGEITWRYSGPRASMYRVEHEHLFKAIHAGKPINNGDYMALSTMVAIMGRMATYTGSSISWEEAINSDVVLGPQNYEWGQVDVPPVALPGITENVG
ncbi:MAG: Gfo/Idh/MocA family oxidoreductase [Pirellulales bacterium]|nr:Gfo/Idh/MocA family oxidoreductase [Pirellulales bacterium]